MSDRELLELAAKAVGVDARRLPHAWPNRFDDDQWDPLIDNGDALWLAVRLRIEYIFVSDRKTIQCSFAEHTELGDWETYLCDEPIGDDVCASMRRAIVRAAAEIAKTREA
ncbi:hypothetical protein [Burkholderia latens]|uniref:hypothetical protein n=1 Tax=Burkholderia latens TaxID=488446 RepID=UPI001AE1D6E7|nr:hypothetical protein [Burkholderia latens]QTO46370.1 hypothetical protein J8I85_18165 [Burkholderia latens]